MNHQHSGSLHQPKSLRNLIGELTSIDKLYFVRKIDPCVRVSGLGHSEHEVKEEQRKAAYGFKKLSSTSLKYALSLNISRKDCLESVLRSRAEIWKVRKIELLIKWLGGIEVSVKLA